MTVVTAATASQAVKPKPKAHICGTANHAVPLPGKVSIAPGDADKLHAIGVAIAALLELPGGAQCSIVADGAYLGCIVPKWVDHHALCVAARSVLCTYEDGTS